MAKLASRCVVVGTTYRDLQFDWFAAWPIRSEAKVRSGYVRDPRRHQCYAQAFTHELQHRRLVESFTNDIRLTPDFSKTVP